MMFNKYKKWLSSYLSLAILLMVGWSPTAELAAQANIKVRVLSVQTLNSVDCDGFAVCESDFEWEFQATDNTLGFTNHNPFPILGIPAGLLGTVYNRVLIDNNNGAYNYIIGTPGIETGCFPNPGFTSVNPSGALFFDHDYVCPADVPTALTLRWVAYEDDLTGRAGESAIQNIVVALPPTTGNDTLTYFANSTDGGCNQRYSIVFRIERVDLVVNSIPDAICNAIQIPVNGAVQHLAWCPDATLEAGEPNRGDVSANRSRWVYFVAPASGRVDISTDNSGTEFGTYFEVYHAADGAGCNAGLNPFGTLIKRKFDYLSYVDFADTDGVVGSEARLTFEGCGGLSLFSNALVAGQTYYIQITTDDPGQRGYIDINITDRGGSPAPGYDIPCASGNATVATAVRTFDGGQPQSADMPFSCATGRETGDPYAGADPTQFQAYDYNHNATNNGGIDESLWFGFTAPNSGRIYFEGNVRGALGINESENIALFGYDARFQPNIPAGYSCANLANLNAAEGGTGFLGANTTAILTQPCLEPGYRYYGMVDPSSGATGSDAKAWIYDPSVSDPNNNPPGNDILCLALLDTLFRVPVVPLDTVLPFAAVAGSNVRACREALAGEPITNPVPGLRANQTVWHYFTAPASGVADIRLRAYIGMNRLNYAVYPLLNGNSCYGGLAPATYTQNGASTGAALQPLASGSTDFNGTTFGLCCLTPGAVYAIQLDGGAPGDQGQYIIEFIREIEVYAGDSRYTTQNGDTINFNSNDTAYICYGDTIFPGVMLNALGQPTVQIPLCIDTGFVLHNTFPTPNPIANVGFTFIDSMRSQPARFINNGNGSGAFRNPLFNQVYYVSALADEDISWGRLTCTSASMENGAPVVFLQPITGTTSYNPNTCSFTFSATGGLPAYNGSLFHYIVTNATGDTIFNGNVANATNQVHVVPVVGVYTITLSDSVGCAIVLTVNASTCLDPCINNPVRINPRPLNNSIYTCQPGGSALVTLQLTGGAPTLNGSSYTVTLSGSTFAGQNGVRTQAPVGGANPTPFTFQVRDTDNWQLIVEDANGCRDTARGTFFYNQSTCPNFCNIDPIVVTSTYNCFANGSALVQVTIGGGQPARNGSPYFISIAGSTVFGQTFNNAQIAGNVGGTVQFSFLVNNGDTWQLIARDTVPCADTLGGTYQYNVLNCPNLCALAPVRINPDPLNSSIYACNSNGTATVSLNLSGGDPAINGTQYTVSITGSSVAGQNGVRRMGLGLLTFSVADGDNWQVIVRDTNTCADTAAARFDFNQINCPNICNLLGIDAQSAQYACNANGTATVTVILAGGKPAYNGSNYNITVTGSTAGGNTSIAARPGQIGGTTTYQFLVRDGDNWQIKITDVDGCRDSLGGRFTFNLVNCPNLCTLLPLQVLASSYVCDANGNATVQIGILGGIPAYNGSNYNLNISGTNTGSNATNLALAGVIGDTVFYTITVTDGDNWQVQVNDSVTCNASAQGNFAWNATNCGNLCTLAAYQPILLNGGNGFTYNCNGQGGATVRFRLTGGFPALAQNGSYTVVYTINGVNYVNLVSYDSLNAFFNLPLNNNDVWSVTVFDDLGCDTASISNITFNTVNAVASTDVTNPILVGEFAQLIGSASTGNRITYSWSPTTRVNNPTAAVTQVQPVQTIYYTLTVRDSLGCVDKDSVEVPVGACVPLHAGFTPNSDGVNDTWVIPCLTLFDNEVEVYNRWGQLVYARQNYDGTWDGKNSGQDLAPAAYYYVIKVMYPGFPEPTVYKGTVTILR